MDAAWAPGQSRGSPLKPSLPSCIQFPGWTTPLGRPEPSDGELFWVSGLPDLVGGSPGVCAVLGPLHLSSLWHDAHPCVFCDCGGRAPLALGKARPQAPPHLLLPPCSRVLAHNFPGRLKAYGFLNLTESLSEQSSRPCGTWPSVASRLLPSSLSVTTRSHTCSLLGAQVVWLLAQPNCLSVCPSCHHCLRP